MKRLILACLVAVITHQVEAAPPYGPTEAEMATLPTFCRARMGSVSPAQKSAAERSLGVNNFVHIHHYCLAANFFQNRLSSARTPQDRAHMFNEIVGNYEYVLKHSERTFWLRPQVHLELGRVYERMQQRAAAMGQYSQAIGFNPDFQSAYLPLLATQRSLGDSKGALETATEGLRRFPTSEGLKKAYLSLGGKQPFPAPLDRGRSSSKAAGKDPNAAQPDRGVTSEAESAANSRDGASEAAERPLSAEEIERGCRFCPPEEIQRRWRESFGEPSGR